MRLQRYLAWISAVLLLAGLFPKAFAQESQNAALLTREIVESCTYGVKADLSQYALKRSDLETLYFSLYDNGKLPWYAGNTYTCYYDEDTDLVQTFEPNLLDESSYNRSLYEQQVAQVLAECVLDGMDPIQIALSIHDWLVVNTIYDISLEKNTGYDLLVNGTTVCAGYASAYQDLLNRAGVPCVTVTSEEMEHAWNLVSIDGQWYHVDVTWDDPSPDTYGYAGHRFFLLTDGEISAGDEPHYGWETDISCTDTRFSQAYWRDIDSRICFTDSTTACFVRSENWSNYIYARDTATNAETLLFTDKKSYLNIGQGQYTYIHGSLSLWNGRLYYNTMDTLVSMQPDGTDLRTEYTYDARSNGKYLFRCFVEEDMLFASAADHEGSETTFQTPLESTGYHSHSYTGTPYEPACLDPGYTLFTCQCGLSFQSDLIAPTGHSYQRTERKIPTFFSAGYTTSMCRVCGNVETIVLPQIDPVEWVKENAKLCLICAIVLVALISSLTGRNKQKSRA